jgi:hypothetical protein
MTWLDLNVSLTEGSDRLEQVLQQLKLRQQEKEQFNQNILETVRERLESPEGSNPLYRRRRIEPIGTRLADSDIDSIRYTVFGRWINVLRGSLAENVCQAPEGEEIVYNFEPIRGGFSNFGSVRLDARTGKSIIPGQSLPNGYMYTIGSGFRTFQNCGSRRGIIEVPSAISEVALNALFEDSGKGDTSALFINVAQQNSSRLFSWDIETKLRTEIFRSGQPVEIQEEPIQLAEGPSEVIQI